MTKRDDAAAVADFADACIRCGLCTQTDCGNYAPGTPCLGDICQAWLDSNEDWRHFPYTCALCNRCTVNCPVDLKASAGMKPLRALVLEQHAELRPNYRHFRTDLKHNLFALMKGRAAGEPEERHIIEGERGLGEEADATVFFPGCSLYAYAPGLTDVVFSWLREERIASRLLTMCCGATFWDTGFAAEFETYRKRVVELFEIEGIHRVVLCCPHCAHILPSLLEGVDVEFVRLSELLLERGKVSDFSGSVSFHDACYDRDGGVFGTAARKLFPQANFKPLAHEKRDSICCGGGGMVSAYARDFCTYRRNQRLGEIDDAAPDVLVSTCFSCVNSLQRGKRSIPVRHYLELVFGVETNWADVYEKVDALYADPQTAERFATAEELLTPEYLEALRQGAAG